MSHKIKSGLAALGMVLGAIAVTPYGADAQTANPLRPAPGVSAPAAPAATTPAAAPAEKVKRARSPAQLANDNRMRACGAEWRANKAALTAQGKNWRSYSTECRARLKAAGQ